MFFRVLTASAALLFFTLSCTSLPESLRKAQKEQIAQDLPVIRRQLKNRLGDRALEERFQRIWIQKQKELNHIPAVFSLDNGQEIERFQNQYYPEICHDSFFTLPAKFVFTKRESVSHNIGALLALRDRLRSSGIQLIILLIPDAEQIAARAMVQQFGSSGSVNALQCAATLLEFGLEAVYADDAVMAQLPVTAERLFCYPDPRPEAALWKILAGLAADRLGRFGKDHFKEDSVHFAERRGPTVFGNRYRWPEGVDCGDHKGGETVESLQVFRNGVRFRPDPKSAILVIGGEVLNLPGPGHTFSGMFSKELHYSVDELVLPGNGWIHNLPAVLVRQSRRYLKGKQAAVMVIAPQTLAEYQLPNLNQLETLERDLKKQKPVHRFRINYSQKDFILPSVPSTDRNFTRRKKWNLDWKAAAGKKSASAVRIRESAVPQDFLTLKMPEKLTSKPMTLVLNLASYPEQTNVLIVNGQTVPLPVSSGGIRYSRVAVPLEAGTAEAVLKFSGRQDNLLLVRDITLYQ